MNKDTAEDSHTPDANGKLPIVRPQVSVQPPAKWLLGKVFFILSPSLCPQVYDYAMAAVAEPVMKQDLHTVAPVGGGGVAHALPPALSMFTLLLGSAALN